MPRPEKENIDQQPQVQQDTFNTALKDHEYLQKDQRVEKVKKEKPPKQVKPRKQKEHKKLQELQNKLHYENQFSWKKSQEPYNMHSGILHKVRDQRSEFAVLYEFLTKGKSKSVFSLNEFEISAGNNIFNESD